MRPSIGNSGIPKVSALYKPEIRDNERAQICSDNQWKIIIQGPWCHNHLCFIYGVKRTSLWFCPLGMDDLFRPTPLRKVLALGESPVINLTRSWNHRWYTHLAQWSVFVQGLVGMKAFVYTIINTSVSIVKTCFFFSEEELYLQI